MGGSAIQFCCSIAYPICDLADHKCYSQFEKDMLSGIAPEPIAVTEKVEVQAEVAVQNDCDDGTSHCSGDHPICCFQGSAIQFCCPVAYPICDLADHNCHSQFEQDVMSGMVPEMVSTSIVLV